VRGAREVNFIARSGGGGVALKDLRYEHARHPIPCSPQYRRESHAMMPDCHRPHAAANAPQFTHRTWKPLSAREMTDAVQLALVTVCVSVPRQL